MKKVLALLILILCIVLVQACASPEEGNRESELEATIQAMQTQMVQPSTQPGGSAPGDESSELTQSPFEATSTLDNSSLDPNPTIPADSSQFNLIGQHGGSAFTVAVQGIYAYLGQGPRLVVLDVSQPDNPRFVSQSQVLPGLVQGISVSGNYAYLAVRYSGLIILDISDPTNPVQVSKVEPPIPGCTSITVQGQLAYLACNPSGLFIVDISDPAQPIVVSADQLRGAMLSIAVAGQYAYLVDSTQGGLQVIDVSNPSMPVPGRFISMGDLEGYQPQGSGFYSARLCGNNLCLAAHVDGLVVMDLTDRQNPKYMGHFDTAVATGLAAEGDILYMVDDMEGFYVLDISNPSQPQGIGLMPTSIGGFEFTIQESSERGVYVHEGLVYVTDSSRGLVIVDARTPSDPLRMGHYQTPLPDVLQDLELGESMAYVVGRNSGFRVVDVSDPANPVELAYDDQRKDLYLQNPTAIQVKDNYAYISDANYPFHVYDVSNPYNPVQVSAVFDHAASDGAFDLSLVGNTVYLSGWGLQDAFYPGNGLWLIDVSDPTQSKAVRFVDLPNQRWRLDAEGTFLYMVDGQVDPDQAEPLALRILDIREPLDPTIISTQPQAVQFPLNYSDIDVQNQVAYLPGMMLGLDMIDLSNPNEPAFLHRIPGAKSFKALAHGNSVFLDSLMALDIRDLGNPQISGFTPVYEVWGYAASGDLVYVVTSHHGLYIYDFRIQGQ